MSTNSENNSENKVKRINKVKRLLSDNLQVLSQRNFLVFLKVELGLEIARPQREWWEILKRGDDCSFLAPRDTGKSTSMVRAYFLWRLKYYSKWVRDALLIGPDQSSAVENLDRIKVMVSESRYLRHLTPTDRRYFNTREEVKFSNGVVIKAKSMMAPLRGRHPQLILLDDVVNEKNSLTSDGRRKVRNYFFGVVFPLKDKGTAAVRSLGHKSQIVVVGTAIDPDDLYHELEKNPHFLSLRQRSILSPETKEVLYPERYSWEDLMKIKETIGSLQFGREYMNEPVNDETTLFPSTLFEPLKDYTRSYKSSSKGINPVYMGVDFSVPGDSAGDYTAEVIGERLPDGTIVLLAVFRTRGKEMIEQVNGVRNRAVDFNITRGLLEDNMFQRVYLSALGGYNLPLKGVTVTATGKNSLSTGVLGLRTLFERRRVILPYRTEYDKLVTDQLITEFGGVVRSKGKLGNFAYHDDVVMAFWHMWTASEEQGFDFDVL